ncbi:peptidylprolyl isomerase, partial [Rhodopseudomonas sp. B29]|uniref:peptidylprolyl isomerase n=1 Tax=Rhodopseudomonas sp. B29 TaxID=95607 RepID=UPI000594195A
MLRGMRKASSNWVGKTIMSVVMGVLIISFGVWGIADIFRGFGRSTLAKVGHTEISTEQFRQTYNDRLQQIGRSFGRPLTPDMARSFGIDQQVLQQTIAEAALDEDARRLGLGQTEASTMKTILEDPNFKGTNGQFDPNRFQQLIRQFGYTEQRYIAEQRRVALRRQIAGTITEGLEPSKTLLQAMSQYQNEQRSIDYLKLTDAQVGTIDPPSAEALTSYYNDHKTQFLAPEYRKVSFVVLTPESLAKWTDVSDADARAVFDQRKDKLATPEKRDVLQMSFPNADEAKAARDKIAAGTSFEDLAKERGQKPGDYDLGLVTKADMLDPAVANAAFSLPQGEVSQPVQGQFGTVLLKVAKIEPGSEPDFAAAAPQIKREIALDRARKQVQDLHDKMEDARGGGASVIDAAKQLGLNAVTVDAIDRSGKAPNGQPVAGIPQGLDLTSSVFNSDVGVDTDTISFQNGFVWYDVLGITPAHERSFDEVKAEVETRWRAEQVTSRLRTMAAELVQKLGTTGKLADVAPAGVKVETATGLKRETASSGIPGGVVAAVFRTPKEGFGQGQGTSGTEWFVYQVTDIGVPPIDMASADTKKRR